MQPKHRSRRIECSAQLHKLVLVKALHAVHDEHSWLADPHDTLAKDGNDGLEGGDAGTPAVDDNLDLARVVERSQGDLCATWRQVDIRILASGKLPLLVGDEDLGAADDVNVAVVAQRDDQPDSLRERGIDPTHQAIVVQKFARRNHEVLGSLFRDACRVDDAAAIATRTRGNTLLLSPGGEVVPKGVDASFQHIVVCLEIVAGVESLVWVAALPPAGMVIVHSWIDTCGCHIRIVRQIVACGELGADQRDSVFVFAGDLQ